MWTSVWTLWTRMWTLWTRMWSILNLDFPHLTHGCVSSWYLYPGLPKHSAVQFQARQVPAVPKIATNSESEQTCIILIFEKAVTCSHSATCSHLQPLAATCSHLQLLAATCHLGKKWFCRFYFFFKHRLKHRYKSCFGEKTKGQIVCIWGPALICSQRTYDYLFSNFCGLFNDGLP